MLFKYVFVFWNPLQKTSLPLAELQAVIRRLAAPVLVELVSADKVLVERSKVAIRSKHVAIAPLLQSAIVVSTDSLDISGIVAQCGYLHSGGRLVLGQKWIEVDDKQILTQCRSYLSENSHDSAKLTWYCATSEPKAPDALRSLLIDDTRYHLGDRPFRLAADEVSSQLQTSSSSKHVPLYAYRDRAQITEDSRIYYLEYPERDVEDYLVIYESEAKKDNPIHSLDEQHECKPFWAGIFNTPHRLINALLNLADIREGNRVVDPFSYSGTVAIESSIFRCLRLIV